MSTVSVTVWASSPAYPLPTGTALAALKKTTAAVKVLAATPTLSLTGQTNNLPDDQLAVVGDGSGDPLFIGATGSYQWLRGTAKIGTNSPKYTLTDADSGKVVSVVVTVTSGTGTSAIKSTETFVAGTVKYRLKSGTNGTNAAPTPTITGTYGPGGVLTANEGK